MQLSAGLFDAILVLVALEFIMLALLLVRAHARALLVPLFFFLASGAALMFALRTAIGSGASLIIQAMMLVSLLTHIAAIAFFWRAWRGR